MSHGNSPSSEPLCSLILVNGETRIYRMPRHEIREFTDFTATETIETETAQDAFGVLFREPGEFFLSPDSEDDDLENDECLHLLDDAFIQIHTRAAAEALLQSTKLNLISFKNGSFFLNIPFNDEEDLIHNLKGNPLKGSVSETTILEGVNAVRRALQS